jgi:hypothetical protein
MECCVTFDKIRLVLRLLVRCGKNIFVADKKLAIQNH